MWNPLHLLAEGSLYLKSEGLHAPQHEPYAVADMRLRPKLRRGNRWGGGSQQNASLVAAGLLAQYVLSGTSHTRA